MAIPIAKAKLITPAPGGGGGSRGGGYCNDVICCAEAMHYPTSFTARNPPRSTPRAGWIQIHITAVGAETEAVGAPSGDAPRKRKRTAAHWAWADDLESEMTHGAHAHSAQQRTLALAPLVPLAKLLAARLATATSNKGQKGREHKAIRAKVQRCGYGPGYGYGPGCGHPIPGCMPLTGYAPWGLGLAPAPVTNKRRCLPSAPSCLSNALAAARAASRTAAPALTSHQASSWQGRERRHLPS
jgi:hypothetical protein